MSEQRLAYVVTAGSYSSYRILRVFTNRPAAETFVETVNRGGGDYGSEADIEEFPLNDAAPVEGLSHKVTVDEQGAETNYRAETCFSDELFADENSVTVTESGNGLPFFVRAASFRGHDVALKIARDKLAEYKARKQGL